MQFQHRCFQLALCYQRCNILCALHGLLDQSHFFLARCIQHKINHFGAVAGYLSTQQMGSTLWPFVIGH
mgnify:CR=1 FL=1